eukprot:3661149-Amphidinium_carterae.1
MKLAALPGVKGGKRCGVLDVGAITSKSPSLPERCDLVSAAFWQKPSSSLTSWRRSTSPQERPKRGGMKR